MKLNLILVLLILFNNNYKINCINNKYFNVLLEYCTDFSFLLRNGTCMNIMSSTSQCNPSSFKIEFAAEDDLFYGIQYNDEDCIDANIDNKYPFQCSPNEMDIFTNDYFQVACTNKLILQKEPPKEDIRIRMEQFGLGINIDNTKDFLQLLNDQLPKRIFTRPKHHNNNNDEDVISSNGGGGGGGGSTNHQLLTSTNEISPLLENLIEENKDNDKLKEISNHIKNNQTSITISNQNKNNETLNNHNNQNENNSNNIKISLTILLISLIINFFF